VIPLSASAAARPSDGDTPPNRAVFVHALTLGLNVAFARLATDVAQRQRWGSLTYAAAAIAALRQFQPVPVTIQATDLQGMPSSSATAVTCPVLQLAVVNLPLFGGALQLRVPGVQIGNGLLEVLLIEALEPPQLHTLIEGLLAAVGRLTQRMRRVAVEQAPATPADTDESLGFALPGVHRITTPSIRIETPEPVGVALDGEVRARTPLLAHVAAAPLAVLLSVEARAALGIGQAPERNPET